MATQARAITLQIRLSDRRSPELLEYVLALSERSRAGLIRKILEDALERRMLSPEGALQSRDAQINTLAAEIRRMHDTQLGALIAEAKRLGDAIQALLASDALRVKGAPAGERTPQTSLPAAPPEALRSQIAARLVAFETCDRRPGRSDRR